MQIRKQVGTSIALLLIACVYSTARAQDPAKGSDRVSGLYQGVAKMPAGSKDVEFVVEIKNQSGALSGHIDVEGNQLPLSGSYSNGDVILKFKPGDELTITAKATGDRIIGTWEMAGGRTGAIQMKRVSPGWKQVHEMIIRSRAELRQVTKPGGSAREKDDIARKWADQLLDYVKQHSGAGESKDAEDEALLILLRAELIADAADRASQVDWTGDAWKRAIMNQLWSAKGNKNYEYAIRHADALIDRSPRPELKAQIRLAQGDAYWDKGDPAQAKAVFRRVADEYPKTRFAEEASGNIYEIEKLNVGQPGPDLHSKFVDGHGARLADYKGREVLIVFWASW